MWVWRRMLRISWTERKTNTWIQEKMGIPEEQGILQQIKHQNLSKYCHWERRSDSVVLATIKGEIEGKCFPGRRTAWIEDVRRWTGDDMNVARTNAMETRYDCCMVAGCLRVVRPTAYDTNTGRSGVRSSVLFGIHPASMIIRDKSLSTRGFVGNAKSFAAKMLKMRQIQYV